MIGIVSTSGDLHALAIMREFERRNRQDCNLLAIDKIWNAKSIFVDFSSEAVSEFRSQGNALRLADLQVIWWRRPFGKQVTPKLIRKTEKRFIDEQCRAAYWGALASAFKGRWVSLPEATLRASNKILQLKVAQSVGFRVPNTVVSQSRAEVLSFWESCRREVIIKSLVAIESCFLLTRRLDDPRSFEDEAYLVCPAIYQELIPGRRHMRLACFGDRAFAAVIESEDLDWRPKLNVPVYSYDAPRDLLDKARLVLKLLGLEMGIFDLKETPQGEWVWLEVNPQGQFLFLEPITKVALAENFVDFLIECAGRGSQDGQ